MSLQKIELANNMLTDKEFNEIREYFTFLTGNRLDADKRQLVEGRLRKIFFNSKVEAKEYIKLIQNDPKEQSEFISTLTTHKTDWFREAPHFDFLKKHVAQTQKINKDREWKIWSAASSTGEELYSLLMAMNELGVKNAKFLGTDISDTCIKKGARGIYPIDVVNRQVPPYLVNKYFTRSIGQKDGEYYKFDSHYAHQIKWRNFNLINSELSAPILFDFIFLRNVLIYFDAESGFKIANRLLRYLRPGGHLIIGLSETIINSEQLGVKRVENSVYRKN